MTNILTIILIAIIAFEVFAVSPFGVYFALKDYDNGKPMRMLIAAFVLAIPAIVIAEILGIA